MVKNPRFPHTCRIIRPVIPEPFSDDPEPESTSPFADDDEEEVSSQEPEQPVESETPSEASSEEEESEDKGTLLYEGICRGYNRDTTSDNGDVHASYRMLALPLKQDEWPDGTIPRAGDKIILQKIGFTEYGRVLDITPGNLGTHILWKYVRN